MTNAERLDEIAKDKDIPAGWCLSLCLAKEELEQLTRDNANLLKDLKALTQREQKVIGEHEELKALVHEQWDQGSKEYQELKKMWEESGVKGHHSLIEWVQWLSKERDDLAVRLAQAEVDIGKYQIALQLAKIEEDAQKYRSMEH